MAIEKQVTREARHIAISSCQKPVEVQSKSSKRSVRKSSDDRPDFVVDCRLFIFLRDNWNKLKLIWDYEKTKSIRSDLYEHIRKDVSRLHLPIAEYAILEQPHLSDD